MIRIQTIAIDIGRYGVKYYTEHNNKIYKGMFKSIIGEGRALDFSNYSDPIYISNGLEKYFVGTLAELESYQSVRNTSDSKTSLTVQVLLNAVLSKVAMTNNINIMLGVPYSSYTKTVLMDIVKTYQNKKITIKDEILNTNKTITIDKIDIAREADGVLFDVTKGELNEDKDEAFITVGMKTTEISYYSKGQYVDRLSRTIHYGNQDILKTVQNKLKDMNITQDLNYIDSSNDYDDMKRDAYKLASEVLTQKIEEVIPNGFVETNVYIAGGTILNIELDDRFIRIEEPQLSVVRGLYNMSKFIF